LSTDPFLYDGERLESLASPTIVRRGIAYFKENRVTDLGWADTRLWAAVDGTRPGGYSVELTVDEDGELAIDCDCPFDWEPACKHAVAVLLAYGARQPVTEVQAEDAASAAVSARMQRGRVEVHVKHVAGDQWLGTWEAISAESAALGRAPWRVELRSVGERINHCNCPDFAVNRLGTCKHIEAVRHRLRRRAPKRFDSYAREGPPSSIVHLEWDATDAPRIRLRRSGSGAPDWTDRYFDGDGFLHDPVAETFGRLRRASRGRPEVVLTPEVAAHLRRLGEETDRRARTTEIAERIRASGGTLPGVKATLYPYQVEGVAFLAGNGRALLADDMGLGKTVQAIAAAMVLREHALVERVLVVCPASLKHQWMREIRRFTDVETVVVEGPATARRALYHRRAAFTIVNYELLLRDGAAIQSVLAPDLLVLDEAQRIKNWRTRTAAAVRSLETTFAFVLTGTPLENRLEDLYSLMQVVDPRVLGPLWRYLLDFHVTDERGKVLGYRSLSVLRRRLAPAMLRRDRSLVRDQLPDRIDARLDVELDRHQRPLHDDALDGARRLANIMKKRPLTPSEEKRLLSLLQIARMACDAAGLVDKETVGSPKLSELASLLEELCVDGGRKAVVFSQWERMTEMAEGVARTLGLGCVRLHGGVPSHRRGALIDRFRDDPATQVFLSTDAGGVGLNLQSASVLINLDLPWNPAVLEQRIARVHRLGQAEPVHTVLVVARASYEERIAELIAAKRELFRHVVTDEATEDVLGVSKKMVDIALATLAGGEPDGGGRDVMADAAPAEAAAAADASAADTADTSLAPLLARVHAVLGDRIERVVMTGGGMIVVADVPAALGDELLATCRGDVPLALLDPRSWAALARLGAGSPVAGARVLCEPPRPVVSPTVSAAERKLRAAEVLAEGGHTSEALGLATGALLYAAADAAGIPVPPAPERAAVWLHSELVPRALISAEQAAAVGRALALANAPDVPTELVAAVIADAAAVVRPQLLPLITQVVETPDSSIGVTPRRA
jgi:hypothetical protein